jgi:hypothetical protein
MFSDVVTGKKSRGGVRAKLFQSWTGLDMLSPTATTVLVTITFVLMMLATYFGNRSHDMFDGTRKLL